MIAKDAFREQMLLNTVILPYGLVSIGESAFFGCPNLRHVYLPAYYVEIGAYAFAGCNADLILHVEKDSLNERYAQERCSCQRRSPP